MREAGKGEKGISEVDTDKKKAKPKQQKKEVKKPPMSNRKVGLSLGVEASDGTEIPLLEHAAEVGEEVRSGEERGDAKRRHGHFNLHAPFLTHSRRSARCRTYRSRIRTE